MPEDMSDEDIALDRQAFERGRDYELYCVRHSAAHVMAHAVQDIWPEAQFAIGPPIENGFYYDIDLPDSIGGEDLERIADRMREIVEEDPSFERETWSAGEAKEWFDERGQPYKVELIEDIGEEEVSVYTVGDFVDLCKGPHVDAAGACANFELLQVTGAYWRGDENRPMLQRIYGTAWRTADELEEYLTRREEAEKRDHRKLGRELDLFSFHDLSPGCPIWLPKGAHLYRTLAGKMRELLRDAGGYDEVRTPQLFKRELWETSGHWEHFRENMFLFEEDGGDDGEVYSLKPMNCPSHMLIFKDQVRSYRDLPIRIHDQGDLHRNERSGTLTGLTRVRHFRQDDAHVFCTEDQVAGEIDELLDLVDRVYDALDMPLRRVLSTRPEKAMGDPELWAEAEADLREVLDRRGDYRVAEGEGAFYGPKIDHMAEDSIGREHQVATIQLDFQLPRSFELEYVTPENDRETPVVIHRALYGSFERFIAILIEHYAGAFPLWLAPEQVRMLPISEKFAGYAEEVADRLGAAGLRCEVDLSGDRVGAMIRQAEVQKVPYMGIVGGREADAGTVSLRSRDEGDLGAMDLDDAEARLVEEADFSF